MNWGQSVLFGIAVGALWGALGNTATSQEDLTISSNPFVLGQPATVSAAGDPNAWFALMVDDSIGDFTLPGGAWLGLGLSPNFQFLLFGEIAGNGTADFTTNIPNAPGLLGIDFYLQGASIANTDIYVKTSNRLDLQVFDSAAGGFASSLSQHGITWTFDQEYPVGQFANGDWWVQGPVTIINIDPRSVPAGSRTMHGSMVNPSPRDERMQGYDSNMYEWGNLFGSDWQQYDPAMNIALNVSAANPVVVPPHSSIVSTISVAEIGAQQLQAAAILTVLEAPAPEGSFRPAYSGDDKSIPFHISQLRYDKLGNLPRLPSAPSMAEVAALFERPWLDHIPTWWGRFHHPLDNMKNYGRDIAADVGVGAVLLNMDYSQAEKETLMIRMVQLGIDNFGIVEDGGNDVWPANGGHGSGRKFPIVFAGAVLNDPLMSSIGSMDVYFGEDDQTFFVEETSPNVFNNGFGNYKSEHKGMPEWGYWHRIKPSDDNVAWSGSGLVGYRLCCTANAWNGYALACHAMGIEDLWNHDAFFAYMERYIPTAIANNNDGWKISWNDFTGEAWQAYRDQFSWHYDW